MVSSLDGFIEKSVDDFSWLESSDSYDKGISDEESDRLTENTLESIDCYVMGARTYETAIKLGWPYGEVPVFVLTHRDLKSERNTVSFVNGSITELVNHKLAPAYREIWVVGGSVVVKDFLRSGLVDDIRLTVAPYLLGEGTPFFDVVGIEIALHLKDVIAFKNGFVELWYEVRQQNQQHT